jgi:hypothetical protein
VLVIERNPYFVTVFPAVARNARVKWQQELGDAPVKPPGPGIATRAIHDADISIAHLQQRLFVHSRDVPIVFYFGFFVVSGVLKFFVVGQMQETQVRRVEVALHGLKPVAGPLIAQSAAVLGFRHRPTQLRKPRRVIAPGSHESPDDPVLFDTRAGRRADLFLQPAARLLVRRVNASSVNVKFPAVVKAANPVLFVAPKKE